jgi:anhydro-N-acetylmuramic acid kinase
VFWQNSNAGTEKMTGEATPVWAIGLMTGTALDGFVDVALLKTDGEKVHEFGEYALFPYADADRLILQDAVTAARAWAFEGAEPAIFAQATEVITRIYASAIKQLLAQANISADQVAFVGGHGLTVLHRPDIGRTLQLLDGHALAKMVDIDVVYDFRSADMAAGGQGAPLAPIYHAAILAKAKSDPPSAILNLGGVANVTYWGGGSDIAAFDTGPANGPVNEWIEAHGQGSYDKDGAIASRGRVHEGRLLEILDHPWFDLPFPKSLDRYDFDAGLVRGMSLEDGAATLTALVGATLNLALQQLPTRPSKLIVAGGGRKNPVMMADIARRCGVELVDADTVGLRGDAVEAECFALLVVRTAKGLPLSFPATTGVSLPTKGGVMALKP